MKPFAMLFEQNEPYTMISGPKEQRTFSGFIPDLVEALARRMYFRYEFYEQSEHGRLVDGEWTGMIGEVVKNDVRDSLLLSFIRNY